MKKNIRGNVVKETLLDYNNLTDTLKENTSNAVKSLLDEAVRETYAKLLSEGDEDEFDVEEVDDTDTENVKGKTPKKEKGRAKKSSQKNTDETFDAVDTEESDVAEEDPTQEMEGEEDLDMMGGEDEALASEDDGMGEFEDYKVGDNTYNLQDANDETVVKVYKLLKDTDQVFVDVDNEANVVDLKDNETGAEYHIVLDSDAAYENADEQELDFEDAGNENELEDNYSNMTNESIIFEVALNEYDSHVGYTDNYQKKDVMTNPGTSEPGKNVRDWDAGVPKGGSKPWAKPKKNAAPFNSGKGKTVEEEEIFDDEYPMEEATNVGGFVQQNTTSKSHVPNSNGRNARSASKGGKRIKGTVTPRYSSENVEESRMRAQVEKIVRENKQLKNALTKFKGTLQEAAVTNLNLGQIIKLISENTTTRDEKKEIIARFGKEATTISESNKLYESLNNELKKKSTMSINEDKQFTTNGSKMINETQIYKSDDLVKSLDLMHRLMNM